MKEKTMIDPLREMFHYHYWATFSLIDYLSTLPAERLNETAPGTAGTIQETLAHLVRADRLYLSLIRGEGRPPRDTRTFTLSELRDQFEAQSGQWESILDHVDDFDPTLPAESDHPSAPHVRDLLLTQAIHHGNDHRTHICTILGATGDEPPEFDEWAYWFSEQHPAASD